ncbi:unnamed protein product [Calypogeia fissa]
MLEGRRTPFEKSRRAHNIFPKQQWRSGAADEGYGELLHRLGLGVQRDRGLALVRQWKPAYAPEQNYEKENCWVLHNSNGTSLGDVFGAGRTKA